MNQRVAVKQPSTSTLRNPSHVKVLARFDQLGHDQGAFGFLVGLVSLSVANTIQAIIEAVEVHSMLANAGVEPSPTDRFPWLESETLGIGPGLSVDRGNLRRTSEERSVLVPDTDNEDAIGCSGTGWINDEGSGELGLNGHALLQRAAGCGSPIVVGARFARFEAHVLRGS